MKGDSIARGAIRNNLDYSRDFGEKVPSVTNERQDENYPLNRLLACVLQNEPGWQRWQPVLRGGVGDRTDEFYSPTCACGMD